MLCWCLWRRWCSGRCVACLVGRAAWCARGRRPARESSAPRASLGASSFLRVLLVAPRVFRAPEGPAAREARASLRSAPRLEARPCPPDPPAPSTPVGLGRCCLVRCVVSKPVQALLTAARPTGPSGALHTSGVGSLLSGSVCRLEACPVSPHRSQAPPLLRRPRVQSSRTSLLSPHPISHVIPLRLFQTLNSDRWNCNVFGLC